jgi:predicted Zn finger-like uncharacterized protein
MPVEAVCPACGASFRLKEDYAGKKVRCKNCGHVFAVAGEKANDGGDLPAAPPEAATGAPAGGAESGGAERAALSALAEVGQESAAEGGATPEAGAGGKRPKKMRPDEPDVEVIPNDRGQVTIIMMAVVAALMITCGGGFYLVARAVKTASKELDDLEAARKAAQPTAADVGGLIDFEREPKDLPEALSYLRSKVAGDRRGAAKWLAAQQEVNDARRKEVAQALLPLLREEDATCAAAARALKVWGVPEDGPDLAAALKAKSDSGIVGEAPKELMAAIGHAKHQPAAAEVARFLPNPAVGQDAERALAGLGPGAQKAVLKYLDHPNEGARDRARRLLHDYKTQPAAYLDQAAEDLGGADPERARAAAGWLAGAASDDALALAKREPERRTAVSAALSGLIDSPPTGSEEAVLGAAKRWGTKDNVPALITVLTTRPYKRQAADALIAIGPACEPEVKKLLGNRDAAVVDQAKRVLAGIGSRDAKYLAAVEDVKSNDDGRIGQGARALQALPVDDEQRPYVVAALLAAIKDTGIGRGDALLEDVAKALAAWTGKEDGSQVVEKVKEMHPYFCRKSRKILIEWMGKRKVEQAIPFLVGALADENIADDAGKALEAMGPALGEKIEVEVLKAIESKMQESDRPYLLECVRILGAVGTKLSLTKLKSQHKMALKTQDDVMAKACAEAIAAINGR